MENECVIYGLLLHFRQVFIMKGTTGWCLPGVQVEEKISTGLATKEMSRLLGQSVVAYRYVSIKENMQLGRKEGIFIFEIFGSDEVTQLGRWVSMDDLQDLKFDRMDHLEIIREHLSEQEKVNHPRFRQPWERSGWFTQVSSWVKESLGSFGIEMVSQPEQVKWWSLSCVLKLTTTQGNVYFKSNAKQPLFVDEAKLLKFMGTLYPRCVPTVIGTEPRYGWMLLGDAGLKMKRDTPVGQKSELLRIFAST